MFLPPGSIFTLNTAYINRSGFLMVCKNRQLLNPIKCFNLFNETIMRHDAIWCVIVKPWSWNNFISNQGGTDSMCGVAHKEIKLFILLRYLEAVVEQITCGLSGYSLTDGWQCVHERTNLLHTATQARSGATAKRQLRPHRTSAPNDTSRVSQYQSRMSLLPNIKSSRVCRSDSASHTADNKKPTCPEGQGNGSPQSNRGNVQTKISADMESEPLFHIDN